VQFNPLRLHLLLAALAEETALAFSFALRFVPEGKSFIKNTTYNKTVKETTSFFRASLLICPLFLLLPVVSRAERGLVSVGRERDKSCK
jgi:hypothetical protein